MANGITKDTFDAASNETKLGILFDYHSSTNQGIEDIKDMLQQHPTDCERRFISLEKKRTRDSFVSAGMGFMGGFITMAAKLKFWG